MSDDIQKETERIHEGIVASLSFSEALARRDAEIERLRRIIRYGMEIVGNVPEGEWAQWADLAERTIGKCPTS